MDGERTDDKLAPCTPSKKWHLKRPHLKSPLHRASSGYMYASSKEPTKGESYLQILLRLSAPIHHPFRHRYTRFDAPAQCYTEISDVIQSLGIITMLFMLPSLFCRFAAVNLPAFLPSSSGC